MESRRAREAELAASTYRFALGPEQRQTYHAALRALLAAGLPFAVGGTFAFYHYTGLWRITPDLDLFLLPDNLETALDLLREAGFHARVEERAWLAHATHGSTTVDLIFGAGNYLAPVDETWLDHAEVGLLLGLPVPIVGVEELIWSKAYVASRDRFDGSDIAHLLLKRGHRLDWEHLLDRFGEHWDLLLFQLLLFRYCYPPDRDIVPIELLKRLASRERARRAAPPSAEPVCRGTLLDRHAYNVDIERGGIDPREALAEKRGFGRETVVRQRAA